VGNDPWSRVGRGRESTYETTAMGLRGRRCTNGDKPNETSRDNRSSRAQPRLRFAAEIASD